MALVLQLPNPKESFVILNTMNLQGCGTALITPFKQDQSIDEKALRSLVEWQITSGIHFLVP
jgi:dihydrodipicolinate synthase/N-acetylneuraminate lyase